MGTKIQAGIRGKQARKRVNEMKSNEGAALGKKWEDEEDEEKAKEDEKKEEGPVETVEEEVIDIDMDAPETAAAATKIQAGFKGKQARKEVQEMKAKRDETEAEKEEVPVKVVEEEVFDIDMEDPETAAAATKIQAGFKGKQARKEVQEMKAKRDE